MSFPNVQQMLRRRAAPSGSGVSGAGPDRVRKSRLTFRVFPSAEELPSAHLQGSWDTTHSSRFVIRGTHFPVGAGAEALKQCLSPTAAPVLSPARLGALLSMETGVFKDGLEPLPPSFSTSQTLTKQPQTGTCRTAASITRDRRSVSLDVEKHCTGFGSPDDPVLA
jgi:hypothetical protein